MGHLEWVAMGMTHPMTMEPKVVEAGMEVVAHHTQVLPAVAPAIISKAQ